MSSIADQIIGNSNEFPGYSRPARPRIFEDIKFDADFDELGLPVSAIDDYMIARILRIDYIRKDGVHLYVKDDDIYMGRDKLKMNSTTLIKLAKWHYPLRPHLVPWLWERLKEVLPEESKDKIIVAPGVTWDRANGELTDENEEYCI